MRTAKSYLFGAALLAAFTVIFAMASCKFSADYLGDMSSVNAAAVAAPGETNASDQGNGETDASNQGGGETDATDTDESGTEQGTGGEEGAGTGSTEPETGNGGEESTGTGGTEPGTETGNGGEGAGTSGTEPGTGNGGEGTSGTEPGTETGNGGEGAGTGGTEKPTEPQKPAVPQLSNFRWGKSIDNVKEENKANWRPATYNKGDDVYVGLDLDVKADEVSSIKFTISRNGKLEWWYIVPNKPEAPYIGKLGEKSIWVNYPNGPTNFEGKLTLWLDITFNNGTVAGIGGEADVKKEFPVTNIRWGTTADSVKEANKANWKNAVIRTGDALYVGFDTDTSKVESIKFMLARNDKDGKNGKDNFKLYAFHGDYKDWGVIDAKGIWASYTQNPTNYVGEAKVNIEIKYKNGALSYAFATIPVREALAPAITNIRWGTTADSVKEANKANWQNAVIRTGDALYVGFDTDTSKVESIKFMLARNDKDGKNGKDNFKLYAVHGDYKDWGIIDAKGIWASYTQNPTNYVGEAKVSIEVKYKDGKLNWANATIPVKEALAPAITNIRWGTTADSVKEANKANWQNAVIRTGDALYVGFDTDTSKVESIKFMLARNDKDGKNGKDAFKLYAFHGDYKDWGIIDAKGVWASYTQNPTNFVGEAKVSIEVKYKDGKLNWANATIPVKEFPVGNLRKITFEQTGLPAELNPTRFNAEYYEYGEYPQSLKKDNVQIKQRSPETGFYEGSDGEWYAAYTTATYEDRTKKSADGRDIKDNTTYYFKVEPIIWQRLPNSNKLISMKILTANYFYRSRTEMRSAGNWKIYPSNYYNSIAREWTQYFIAMTMTPEQRNALLNTEVGINQYEYHMDYVWKDYKPQDTNFLFSAAPMYDKAWFWSKQEVSNPNAFGASGESGAATNRVKVATDCAIALGLDVQRKNNVNYGSWWLRSPYWKSGESAQIVGVDGHANSNDVSALVDNRHIGYVPGIQLPADVLNNAYIKK